MKRKANTSCHGCAFIEISDYSEQCGCKVNRSDYFEKDLLQGDDYSFYLLDGLCNMYREDDGDDIEIQKEKQYKKIEVPVSYIIISDKSRKEDIEKTLDSIESDSNIYIFNTDINTILKDISTDKNVLVYTNFDTERSLYDFVSEEMKKIKNSLICVVWAGYNIPRRIEEDLNKKINLKMSKNIVFEYDNCYVTYSNAARAIGYFKDGNLLHKLRKIQNG